MSAHLHDIARLVGNEQHVELLKRLVDESYIWGLYGGMLRVDRDEFGKGSEESIDARPWHGSELARQEGYASISERFLGRGNAHASRSSCILRRRGRPKVSLAWIIELTILPRCYGG